MNLEVDFERQLLAHKSVRAELLAERAAGGQWVGHVSSSPLATAAAISALVMAHRSDTETVLRENDAGDGKEMEQLVQCDLSELLVESLHWLASHQNSDGGWGDCEGAESNIASTMLVQAGFRLTGIPAKYADLMVRADDYVEAQGGIAGLRRQYGNDKAFVAAVLINCALAGMVPWRQVPVLRYELAFVPNRWQDRLQLPVARHARALFIAAGKAKFHYDPPKNPITRLMRGSLRTKSLAILERFQAADDSFLASPAFTAFVVTSLASVGCQEHSIVRRGVEFLLSTVRADSSWPVAANLATRNTALSLNSLAGDLADALPNQTPDQWDEDTASVGETVGDDVVRESDQAPQPHQGVHADDREFDSSMKWLLDCQRTKHDPLTEVPAGGWASSDSPGALANTIDTASVLLALDQWRLRKDDLRRGRLDRTATTAIAWLMNLQSGDGGWPTFYRDSGSSDAEQSSIDPTAQVVRALAAWRDRWRSESPLNAQSLEAISDERITSAIRNGLQFLGSRQRDDGSFVPQWFGNEHQPESQNPVVGTSHVLTMCDAVGALHTEMAQRAARWLLSAQHLSGGWGPPRAPVNYSGAEKDGFRAWRGNESMAKYCSVEETASAINALLPLVAESDEFSQSCSRGLTWLINAVEQDAHRQPAVIGFYLSKLWYHERLYPLAFASQALTQAARQLAGKRPASVPAS